MKHVDRNPESDWGIIETDRFQPKEVTNKRFFVIDNFYEDPYGLREFALQQTYFPGEGAVGFRTRKQFFFDGVRERFESVIGEKIADHTETGLGWFDEGINGRFQYCPAGTPSVFHCDTQKWAAVIYLTPDAPPQSGTCFYRHRETKIHHNTQMDWGPLGDGFKVFPGNTFLDGTPYEMVDTVGNIFNRAVIFDGGLIHSGVNYFGYNMDNSRLFHIFFFDQVYS